MVRSDVGDILGAYIVVLYVCTIPKLGSYR